MPRYFIADIHLADNQPVLTTGFLLFLDGLPDHAELYILGDLFDYWVGDDIQTPLHQTVAQALHALAKRHIKTYFVHGNRDFLLGKNYAKSCNMTILQDINVLSLNQGTLIFLHGDLLCTDDVAYQKFRRRMHCKWLQRLFLLLPLRLRQKIAAKLRQKSINHNRVKSHDIMDVNQQAVNEMMLKYDAIVMIHGHTHKPATHAFLLNNASATRMVLGAWHEQGSYIVQNDLDGSIHFYNHSFK